MNTSSQDQRQSDWSVVPLALAVGLGLGVVGWWLTQEEPSPAAAASATPPPLPPLPLLPPRPGAMGPREPAPMAPAAVSPVAASAVQQAASMAQVPAVPGPQVPPPGSIDADFGRPLASPVRTRPPFMDANEWDALHAIRQDAQTDEYITRVVNSLRFHRLLERWRMAMPGTSGGDGPRARAAVLLLDDLKTRLQAGDIAVAEARNLVPELLQDAVANPNDRARQAQVIAETINQVKTAPVPPPARVADDSSAR